MEIDRGEVGHLSRKESTDIGIGIIIADGREALESTLKKEAKYMMLTCTQEMDS